MMNSQNSNCSDSRSSLRRQEALQAVADSIPVRRRTATQFTDNTTCGCNGCNSCGCNSCGCNSCGCNSCGCNSCGCNSCGCNSCGCNSRSRCGCNCCDNCGCDNCGCDNCGFWRRNARNSGDCDCCDCDDCNSWRRNSRNNGNCCDCCDCDDCDNDDDNDSRSRNSGNGCDCHDRDDRDSDDDNDNGNDNSTRSFGMTARQTVEGGEALQFSRFSPASDDDPVTSLRLRGGRYLIQYTVNASAELDNSVTPMPSTIKLRVQPRINDVAFPRGGSAATVEHRCDTLSAMLTAVFVVSLPDSDNTFELINTTDDDFAASFRLLNIVITRL